MHLKTEYGKDSPAEKEEYIIRVDWIKTVPQSEAVSNKEFFSNQNTAARPTVSSWDFTIAKLKELWDI